MLTEFSIGNYQAFSTPQRVPIKPITLIFGPNSAGKSSLLRSLLVARHAILNGKLSKSEGAGERHPGAYADIVRNGSSNPISFGFTVQPEGDPVEEALELGLSWKENEGSGLETVAFALKQKHTSLLAYSAKWNSKHLQIGTLGAELAQLMAAARSESDLEGSFNELVHKSVMKRLALQKNVALPGTDEDYFRVEESTTDEIDLLSALEEVHTQGKPNDLVSATMHRIKTAVDSLKSAITTPMKVVKASVTDTLVNLIYHGPIRPICDEITKARQAEPGMMEWWKLAEDEKLLTKVNDWLASDIFKTKYQLKFDRLFPESLLEQFFPALSGEQSIGQLVQAFSGERSIGQIVEAAFEAKLDADEHFYESHIEPLASDMEANLEDEYADEDERRSVARQNAHDAIYNDCRNLGMDHYNSLLADSDVEEIESFLLEGLNRTLANLRGMLKSVRQGRRTKRQGGFDSAKVLFSSTTSSQEVSPSNMGIGFSQMMPLAASAFGAENSLIAIEQPELHVHPALQTELADLFIQSAKERGNRFLIETHSEHLILRLLRRVRETTEGELENASQSLRPEDLCVLYVEPTDEGSRVIELPVTRDGDFRVPWPGGFFAERVTELFGPSSKEVGE